MSNKMHDMRAVPAWDIKKIKGHENENRMSFRSRGKFSVNDFARENFEGGGHVNAAGGVSHLGFDETVEKVISLLPKYADEINNSY